MDAPAVYDQWQPQNYEVWRHQGAIRLRDALAGSVNVVAVRVMEQVQPTEVVDFARALGITTELDAQLSLALGSSGVRPIEMVNAYATFAAGGRWAPYRVVTRIEGPEGDVSLPAPEPPRDVMTPAEAFVLDEHDGERRSRRDGAPREGPRATRRGQDRDEQRGAGCVVYRLLALHRRWRLGRLRR